MGWSPYIHICAVQSAIIHSDFLTSSPGSGEYSEKEVLTA